MTVEFVEQRTTVDVATSEEAVVTLEMFESPVEVFLTM